MTQPARGRIGVPRSILHFEFDGRIERFLRSLGVEVLLSPETNQDIFTLGKRVVLDELCFPIKIFIGHVAWLAMQEVDRIVIPTIVGHENNRVFPCHPRSRLADMVLALDVPAPFAKRRGKPALDPEYATPCEQLRVRSQPAQAAVHAGQGAEAGIVELIADLHFKGVILFQSHIGRAA